MAHRLGAADDDVRTLDRAHDFPRGGWVLSCAAMLAVVAAAGAWGVLAHDATPALALTGGAMLLAGCAGLCAWRRAECRRVETLYESESALRAALDRQRISLRSIGDAVVTTDASGAIDLLNPAAEALTGWSDGEARGRPVGDVLRLVDEDTRMPLVPAQRVLAEGVAVGPGSQTLLVARDGAERPVAESCAPIRTDSGRVVGVVVVLRDQTAERLGDQALRDSEALLRESQEVAGVGSYVLDVKRGEWSSSAVLDSIFGIGPAGDRSVAGWEQLIHPDDRAAMMRYFTEEVIGRGQRFDREYRILRASDGAERWVHGVGRLEFDADGAPLRMIGTIRDVTTQKEAETEHALLQAQLLQAQKMESVGRLAGGVAHDFNNMLGAILGHAEIALEHPGVPDGVRSDLLDIQRAAQRSAALTSQLLAFARRQTIAPRVIDLNEAIEGMLKMLRRLIGEDIELLWKPAPALWPVKLDPSQVTQILANLCVNARDAIAGVGHLAVETSHAVFDDAYCASHAGYLPGEYVRLTVSDSGHGMDRSVLDHLFEPFFTTKRPGEGTGLGLATVYGIIKQNEGFLNVYSEPGHGTTFTIFFPRDVGSHAPEPTAAPRGESGAEAVRGHGTVLVVEDEISMLRVAAMHLESLGYRVLTASTPGEALHLAASHGERIDLVLTDVVMPGMHGRELVERLRQHRPDIACVYMSGYTADVIARRGVLDEGVRFIQKPFSASALGATVQAALSRTATA